MSNEEERRYGERFDKVFSVYIRGAWGSAFGVARNISEGGMFIESSDPYPLGSRMQVTFYIPTVVQSEVDETEMTAVGEVVHLCFLNQTAAGGRRELMVGMGIRFVGFCEDERDEQVQLYADVQ